MSIFGPLRPATEAHVKARWGGKRDGFRCYLCGHRFAVGDMWRALMTNTDKGYPAGNPLICEVCDGPDVFERWRAHYLYATKRCWWLDTEEAFAGQDLLWEKKAMAHPRKGA